jgi:transmembrane sensor
MARRMNQRLNTDIEDEATQWVVRMHSDQVTSEDERLFSAWLAESEEHGHAYDRQNALWAGVGSLRHSHDIKGDFADLREARPSLPSRRGLLAASLAGGVVVAGGGWLSYQTFFGAEAYATEVGEQRRVILSDGSAVTLNTDTALRVRFSNDERRLWLDRGQAFFAVANDRARPFRVFVGDDEVRAVGTAFDVRREGQSARVTIEDGSVAIYRGAALEMLQAEPPAAVAEAGQQLVVAPAESIQIAAVDTRRTGAWRFGQMVLEADALSTAVGEINRYNARQIVIADPTLNDMRLNGVFQTGRPEAFVEALTAGFPVEVSREDDAAIYLRRRADN